MNKLNLCLEESQVQSLGRERERERGSQRDGPRVGKDVCQAACKLQILLTI